MNLNCKYCGSNNIILLSYESLGPICMDCFSKRKLCDNCGLFVEQKYTINSKCYLCLNICTKSDFDNVRNGVNTNLIPSLNKNTTNIFNLVTSLNNLITTINSSLSLSLSTVNII